MSIQKFIQLQIFRVKQSHSSHTATGTPHLTRLLVARHLTGIPSRGPLLTLLSWHHIHHMVRICSNDAMIVVYGKYWTAIKSYTMLVSIWYKDRPFFGPCGSMHIYMCWLLVTEKIGRFVFKMLCYCSFSRKVHSSIQVAWSWVSQGQQEWNTMVDRPHARSMVQ